MVCEFNQGFYAVVLSSMGLMFDVYDMGVINMIRPALELEFGSMSANQNAMLTSAVLSGGFFGQVCFGVAADILGRRATFVLTTLVMAVGALACSLAQPTTLGLDFYTYFTISRFVMGLGIGGDYPLSALSTVENVDAQSSGFALALVMGGMSVGSILGPCVVIFLTGPCALPQEMVWRATMGFAALIGLLSAILRYCLLEETALYQAAEEAARGSNTEGAPTRGEVASALIKMRYLLAGTTGSWFIYNIAVFGTGLFSTTIFGTSAGMQSATTLLILASAQVPGVLGSLVVVHYLSLRHIQLLGLAAMSICFLLLGVFTDGDDATSVPRSGTLHAICIALFAMQQAFDTMGPGLTTYAVPAQIYPTEVRGLAHGISSAAGKLGAFVGTFLFPYLEEALGVQGVMHFMSTICFAAMLWTWVFTPLYGLEQLKVFQDPKCMGLKEQAAAAERLLFQDEFGERRPLLL